MSREISEYGTTDAFNNPILPADGGMPEGVLRDAVNQGHREMMGAIRRHYNDPQWIQPRLQGPAASQQGVFSRISATQFQINLAGFDLRPWFQDGRIIKIIDGAGAGTDLTTQVEGTATYADPLTTVTLKSTDSMDAASSDAYSFFSEIIRGLALLDSNDAFYIPATDDAAGINAAIVAADAAGGGTVLLTSQIYNLEAAINFTGTLGRVRMLGAGPEVILREDTGAAITPLLNITNANEPVHIENVQFDKQTNSKTGTIIYIDGALRPRIENCVFTGGTDHIVLGSTQTLNVIITDCLLTLFDHHGIRSTAATDTSSGIIANNRIQGSGVTTADPAGIKVAGQWTIEGNVITSMNSASLTVRGIWLWNETANNGGRRSVISGNRVDGDGGTVGHMIEIGGDFVACSGNRINGPTGGTGIYVNGTQAGQTIEHVTISGNTIVRGRPIAMNSRTRHIVVSGNHCEPENLAQPGIVADGQDILVTGNSVVGATVGLSANNNGSDITISGNNVRDSTVGVQVNVAPDTVVIGNTISGSGTTGINLTGAATDPRIKGNVIEATLTTGIIVGASVTGAWIRENDLTGAILTDLSDSGTSTNRWLNSFDKNETHYYDHNDNTANYGSLGVQDFGTLACELPCGGNAGRYILHVEWNERTNTPWDNFTMGFCIGANGNSTDPYTNNGGTYVASNWQVNHYTVEIEYVASDGDTHFCGAMEHFAGGLGTGTANRDFIITSARKIGME